MADAEPFSADAWSEFLTDAVGRPVRVVYTRARRRVLECKATADGGYDLRLSDIFASAPSGVRTDLGAWMRVGKRARAACSRLDAWIEAAVRDLPPARRTKVRPRGATYHLGEIRDHVLANELRGETPVSGAPWPPATWGRRGNRRAVHSLRLGSFEPTENLIRIHPVLDQPAVPRGFVRFVIYHELLHALQPQDEGAHHPPEFRAREAAYPDFAIATIWQDHNLPRLLRSARTGRPMRVRPDPFPERPQAPAPDPSESVNDDGPEDGPRQLFLPF